MEGVICDLSTPESLTTDEGRLWTKISVIDPSGQFELYATEEALLGLSTLKSAQEFVKKVESNCVWRYI